MLALERTHCYRGLYHVLHGAAVAAERRGAGANQVAGGCFARLSDGEVQEVVIATKPDVGGRGDGDVHFPAPGRGQG